MSHGHSDTDPPKRGAHGAIRHRPLRPHEATNPDAALDLVVVVEPDGDASAEGLAELFGENRSVLLELLRVHGGVLFRGFDLDHASFQHVVSQGFQADRYMWMFPMASRWVRRLLRLPVLGRLADAVLGWIETKSTGREVVDEKLSALPDDQVFQFPHHEYGMFFNIPSVIALYCDQAPETQGETLICDAKAGFEAMSPTVRAKFEDARHVRYRSKHKRFMPPFTAPAILRHPIDDHPSINLTAYLPDVFAEVARAHFPESTISTDALDDAYTFDHAFVGPDGAGSACDAEDVVEIARAHLSRAVLLPWKQGDLLLLDNFRLVHGRLNAGFPTQKVLQIMLCDHVRNQNRLTW